MQTPISPLLILRGILNVGLIGLGLSFLSTLDGLPGILLGFSFLYLSFFFNAAFHTGPNHRFPR